VYTAEYYSYEPSLLYTYEGWAPNGLPCDTPSIPECSSVGGSCINGTCQEYGQQYACAGGGTYLIYEGSPNCRVLNASTCTSGGNDPCRTTTAYPTCPNGGTRNGDFCTEIVTYSATETVTGSYSTRILRNTSGTVTTMATYSHSADVRSIKVVTSNNTAIVSAYGSTGQVSLLNSNTYTATSPTTTAKAGIIVAPSSYAQSATVDNFYLK
jgi:hypothetical protein